MLPLCNFHHFHRPNVADCRWKTNPVTEVAFLSLFIPFKIHFYHFLSSLFILVYPFYPFLSLNSENVFKNTPTSKNISCIETYLFPGSEVSIFWLQCGSVWKQKKNASFNVANNQDLYSPKTEPKAHGWTKNPVFPGLWPWLKLSSPTKPLQIIPLNIVSQRKHCWG